MGNFKAPLTLALLRSRIEIFPMILCKHQFRPHLSLLCHQLPGPRDCLHLRTTPIKCESWYNTYFHFWFLKLDIIFPSPRAFHSFIYSFIQPICHFHQTKTNGPIHSWIVGTQPAQSSSHHRRHLSTSKSSPVQQSCGSETGGLWGFRLDPVVHSFARSFERSSFAAPR